MSSWLAMLQDAAEMFVFLAVELSLLFIVISAGVPTTVEDSPAATRLNPKTVAAAWLNSGCSVR